MGTGKWKLIVFYMKEMFEKKKKHVKLWLLTNESTLNHSREPQKHWYKEHQYFVYILNLLKYKGIASMLRESWRNLFCLIVKRDIISSERMIRYFLVIISVCSWKQIIVDTV
jgi:hypothetical protein